MDPHFWISQRPKMLPFPRRTAGRDDESTSNEANGEQEERLQLVLSRRHGRYRSRNCANLRTVRRRRLMGPRLPRSTTNEAAVIEIASELERRRTLLTSFIVNSRMHSLDHAIRVVEGVHLLLENGYSPLRIPEASHAAELFLRSNMSHDVEWTNLRGVESFLQQSRLYSEAHASVRISVSGITPFDEPPPTEGYFTLTSRSIVRFCINRRTLAQFFPSTLLDEFLVQQLIGQEYTVEFSKVFHFRNGLITSHGPFVQVGGMGRLLPTSGSFQQLVRRSLASTHHALGRLEL